MSTVNFEPDEFAEQTVEYLRSRFHPVLPHIGSIGTADLDEIIDSTYEDEDGEMEEKEGDKKIKKFSSFKFVPYTASYEMNLEKQDSDISTKFSFYIRTNDGSWDDLKGVENPGYQKGGVDETREDDFWLTKDILAKSFRKFEITIKTDITKRKHSATIKVDDNEKDINEPDHFSIEEEDFENGSRLKLKIRDISNPFMIWNGGSDFEVIQQHYRIVFEKTIQIIDNDTVKINVKVTNESPFTNNSMIPRIEHQDNGFETKEEMITRYKDEKFTSSGEHSELYSTWKPILFSKKDAEWDVRGAKYGHLLEFFVTEDGINSVNEPYEKENQVEQVINLIFDEHLENIDNRKNGKIIFRNHIIFDEEIPIMTSANPTADISEEIGISKEILPIIQARYPNLYKFQADSIKAINTSYKKDEDSVVLISSRTGGGKTEAFVIPIIDYCIKKRNEPGTKAIIFYPTKALGNDQASRIIDLLYDINQNFKQSNDPSRITVGLSHSGIPKHERDSNYLAYWNGVPLKCPACKNGYLTAVEHKLVKCQDCQEQLDFVILFQKPNFGELTDIFITNPDKLQYDMIEKPDHHGVFGREITCCKKCLAGYALLGKRKCDECANTTFEKKKPEPPKFIVFDEIHQFKGTFGTNALYLHARLKTMFKRYAKRNFEKDWSVCSIGSSATIANALEFSKNFFGTEEDKISIIPENDQIKESYYEKELKKYKRKHIFVMPYSYRPSATCAKVVGYLEARRIDGIRPEPFSEDFTNTGEPLQILGFVNSIGDVGQLRNSAARERTYSFPVEVDGHSTDYDTSQRGEVERAFNRKEVNVIFATPTLEVGVDFDTVNSVIIYGFPYSFNDYVQRIGRGGRGESSLVVTICHNWKPIDHYYFVDARRKISEQHKSIEPIPVTRDNQELIRRHLVASVYDFISSLDDAPSLWDNIRGKLLEEFQNRGDDMYDETKEFSPISSLGLSANQIASNKEFLKNFIEKEKERMDATPQTIYKYEFLHTQKDGPDQKYRFTDMRGTEKRVQVEMIWDVF